MTRCESDAVQNGASELARRNLEGVLRASHQSLNDLLPGFLAWDIEVFQHAFTHVSGDPLFKTWSLAHAIIPIRHMRSWAGPQAVHRQHLCAMNVWRRRCVCERVVVSSEIRRSCERLLHLANELVVVPQCELPIGGLDPMHHSMPLAFPHDGVRYGCEASLKFFGCFLQQ